MKKFFLATIFLAFSFLLAPKALAYSECNFTFVDKLPQDIPYTHTNGITYDAVIAVAGDTGSGTCSTTKYAIYVKTSVSKPYFQEINQTAITLYFPTSPSPREDYVIFATSTNGGDTWSAFSSSIGNITSYDLDGTQRMEYHFRSSTNLYFTQAHAYDFTFSGIPRFNLGPTEANEKIISASAFGMAAPSGETIPLSGSVATFGHPADTINSQNSSSVSVTITHQSGLDGGTAFAKITDSLGGSVEGQASISGSGTTTTTVSGIDASSLQDGSLTITSRVADSSENFSDWSTGTAGVKDVISPAQPTRVAFSDSLVNATEDNATVLGVDGVSGTEIYYSLSDVSSGEVSGHTAMEGDGSTDISINVSSLSDGTLTAEVYLADSAWNHSLSGTATTIKDATFPSATYATSENGWYSSNPVWDINFSDNRSLSSVKYQLDGTGGSWTTLASGLSGTNFGDNWSLESAIWSGLSEGMHEIYFQIMDDAGNVFETLNQSGAFSFQKDITSPSGITGLVADPGADIWTSDDTIAFDWDDVSDSSGSGLSGYSFLLDHSSGTNPDETTDGTASGYVSDSLGSASDWYFHVRAIDNAGNGSAVSSIGPFKIDTKSPDISHENPGPQGAGESILIEAEIDDDELSGIDEARIFYRLKGKGWRDARMKRSSGDTYRKTLDISTSSGDELEYYIEARDNVGNKTYVFSSGKTENQDKAQDNPLEISIISPLKSFEQKVDLGTVGNSADLIVESEVAGAMLDEEEETAIPAEEESTGETKNWSWVWIILAILGLSALEEIWRRSKRKKKKNRKK
ncbi:MAG: hypothetical protein ACOYS2_00855 [Patescibacteria group bacterium]